MSNARIAVVLAAFAAIACGSSPICADSRPVVVELFTSQGCSSCPPADRLLGELARRADVLALGFHISYWDNLGWKDPLSSQASTDRQRAYARQFGGRVYTPQIVVEGSREAVGSDRAAVFAALREAQPAAKARPQHARKLQRPPVVHRLILDQRSFVVHPIQRLARR